MRGCLVVAVAVVVVGGGVRRGRKVLVARAMDVLQLHRQSFSTRQTQVSPLLVLSHSHEHAAQVLQRLTIRLSMFRLAIAKKGC